MSKIEFSDIVAHMSFSVKVKALIASLNKELDIQDSRLQPGQVWKRSVIDSLKDKGLFNEFAFAQEYVWIVAKQSKLSSKERDFILSMVSPLARQVEQELLQSQIFTPGVAVLMPLGVKGRITEVLDEAICKVKISDIGSVKELIIGQEIEVAKNILEVDKNARISTN